MHRGLRDRCAARRRCSCGAWRCDRCSGSRGRARTRPTARARSGSRSRPPRPPASPTGAQPLLRRGLGGRAGGGLQLPRRGDAGDAARRHPAGRLPGRPRPRAGATVSGLRRGGGRARPRADPHRHIEPARQREPRGAPTSGLPGEAGVESELIGPDPERLNLVARIEGAGEGPSLMLMAHTDVVPAPPDGWTHRPVRRDGARRAADRPRRHRHEERARGARRRLRRVRAQRRAAERRSWSSSPRRTRSETSPMSGCRGWRASAPTCAATSRSTRVAVSCSSSPTGGAW